MSLLTCKRIATLPALVLFSFLKSVAADAPNILWVVTDDQRVDSIVAFNQMRHGTANSRYVVLEKLGRCGPRGE